MPGQALWEVQSCKTLSGQYCYGSNRWCCWTFFPNTKMTLNVTNVQPNVTFLDGVISEELWAELSFLPNPPLQALEPIPQLNSMTKVQALSQEHHPMEQQHKSVWKLLCQDLGDPLFVTYWVGWRHHLRHLPVLINQKVSQQVSGWCQAGLWLAGPRYHAQTGAGRQ